MSLLVDTSVWSLVLRKAGRAEDPVVESLSRASTTTTSPHPSTRSHKTNPHLNPNALGFQSRSEARRFFQRSPEKRRKSRSVVHHSQPCSIANAAR